MKLQTLTPLLALFIVACATIDDDVAFVPQCGDVPTKSYPSQLTMSLGEGDESRVQLMAGKSVWTEGDLVSVYLYTTANQKWKFDGNTGDRNGTFTPLTTPESKKEIGSIVAVYPYNSGYWLNSKSCNIEAKLPATQLYAEGSFGVGSSIMVAKGDEDNLFFRNVCGWLRLSIVGDGESVESIAFRGNDEEQVAGRIYIYSDDLSSQLASMPSEGGDGDVGGSLIFDGDIINSVVLVCNGVELSAEATDFYIALPPRTFEKGFTVEVLCSDGRTFERSTARAMEIRRNHILPMATITLE